MNRLLNILRMLYSVVSLKDTWNIGIADAPIRAFLQPGFRPRIRWLPKPRSGTYDADPFGIERDGQRYLFFECFDQRRDYRGRTFVAPLDLRGSMGPRREIFASPNHRSYPYVFEQDGQIYCLPETAMDRRVILCRAARFPEEWVEEAVLLDGVAALDCTIIRHQGRWWLFHTDLDRNEWGDLFIWHADVLTGPWRRHTRAPVKSDAGSSRPGGTPFVHDGQLYRPAQDCSGTYGGRVVIHRVIRLTPSEFEEVPAAYVEPDRNGPYPDGIHTLSALGDVTLVDGKRTHFIPWAMVGVSRKLLRQLARRS